MSDSKQGMLDNGKVIDNSNSTTTFVDDATLVTTVARTDASLQSIGPPKVDTNSIADFLAKPILVHSGEFDTADATNTTLHAFNVEQHLFSSQIFLRKLQGYNLMRATAVVRVVVNAMPFHQGRLLLHFIPMYSNLESVQAYNNTLLIQKTQHPNVELDMRDTSVEMEIPYISPTTYFDLTTRSFDWGRVFLDVQSPIQPTSSSGGVSYSIWLSFKDLELSAPTFEAHSSVGGNRTNVRSNRVRISKKLDAEEKSGSWFSNSLSYIGDAAGALSVIPAVGEVGMIAAGAFKSLSALAAYFGWSRPIHTASPHLYIDHPFRNTQNAMGHTMSDVLGMDPSSKMEPISGFAGSSVDEMSFSYLKSVPAQINNFNITNLDVPGTEVYVHRVTPTNQNMATSLLIGGNDWNMSAYTPIGYLANMFEYWRGGIELTFKFVKTDFHSCRILITFTPDSSGLTPTNQESAYSIRDIVDIRSSREHKIVLPYLVNTNYLRVGQNDGCYSGTLSVKILSTLKAPDTVAQSIQVLVFANGAPDFELAYFMDKNNRPFYAESLQDTSLLSNIASVGDPFLSVKQIIGMVSYGRFTTVGGTGANTAIRPFAMQLALPVTGPALSITHFTGDYIEKIAMGYVFMRGSMRIIGSTPFSAFNVIGAAVDDGEESQACVYKTDKGTVTTDPITTTRGYFYQRPTSEGIDIQVPHASRCHYKLIRRTTVDNTVGNDPDDVLRPDISTINPVILGTGLNRVGRAAGDDLTFGYFIGFPPLLTSVSL